MDAKDRKIDRLERLVAKQEQAIARQAAMIDKQAVLKAIRMLCFVLLAVFVGVPALHDADAREPGLRVASVKLLSEKGSTRSTRYSTANKIVTVGGKTHVAWLDSVSQFPLKSHFPSLFPSTHGGGERSAARP